MLPLPLIWPAARSVTGRCMHATDTGPVRVCLARYEYADDVLEVWGTLRGAASAPPEPEWPWRLRPGGVTALALAPVVCPLAHVPNLSEFAEGITGTAAVVRPYCRHDARVCATCGVPAVIVRLQRCAKCPLINPWVNPGASLPPYYCCEWCSDRDWPVHSLQCAYDDVD